MFTIGKAKFTYTFWLLALDRLVWYKLSPTGGTDSRLPDILNWPLYRLNIEVITCVQLGQICHSLLSQSQVPISESQAEYANPTNF